MAVPSSADARLYYRCAFLRHDEAKVLLKSDFTTGAVYLGGYGVECMLKALVLMAVPDKERSKTLLSFRGGKAHEYQWLRTLYRVNGGARFPREIGRCFALVDNWSTDLRYTPRSVGEPEARKFLAAAWAIILWADGRL